MPFMPLVYRDRMHWLRLLPCTSETCRLQEARPKGAVPVRRNLLEHTNLSQRLSCGVTRGRDSNGDLTHRCGLNESGVGFSKKRVPRIYDNKNPQRVNVGGGSARKGR